MIIKAKEPRFSARAVRGKLLPATRTGLLALGMALVAVGLLALVGFRGADTDAAPSKYGLLRTVANRVRGELFGRPERLSLDLKHRHFQRLGYKREVALAVGRLITTDEDYVPATLHHGDHAIDVRLRLKGDLLDHLKGEKWSYRVKVKGEDALFGMKRFSLQHPAARNFLSEWLFHRALRREGIIALRYDFVEVAINGKDYGVYALEEHFDKRLIEHNRRREGPIVRFDESLFWEEYDRRLAYPEAVGATSGTFEASDIDGFGTAALRADTAAALAYRKAAAMLDAFRRGERAAHEVFDVGKLGTYLAVCDLMGAAHGAYWNNMRFYLNPVTARLEPIGFDGNAGRRTTRLAILPAAPENPDAADRLGIQTLFAKDLPLFEAYLAALERLSAPSYLDDLFADLEPEIARKRDILHREFPSERLPRETFYRNGAFIRAALAPAQGLRAFFSGVSGDTLRLELGNLQGLPVEALGLTYRDSLTFTPVAVTKLGGRMPGAPVAYATHAFAAAGAFAWADSMTTDLVVRYRIAGTRAERTAPVEPPRPVVTAFEDGDLPRLPPNADAFTFLHIDEARRTIRVAPGRWTLDRPLLLPEGYTLLGGAGTTLDLVREGLILAHGPVRLLGTETEPFRVVSSDGAGQGLVVMTAGAVSVLDHVVFENLSHPARKAWSLSGAVTFYESSVRIRHTTFARNHSEDALNVVRAPFDVAESRFVETQADAFDGDFVRGRMTDVTFTDCGNDAFDVSGSEVTLERITIRGVGDKGVSAGEESEIRAAHVTVDGAEIAVSSKDRSVVRLTASSITGSRIGFAVFQKKPEFGAASAEALDLSMDGVEIPYLVENGSTLFVNGARMTPNHDRVRAVLYGATYGKSSR